MIYYLHKGPLNDESINKILTFLNQTPGDVNIGITSEGGMSWPTQYLLNTLNENKERIHLTAVEYIYSAAFGLFYGFKGNKSMTFACMGMTHYGSNDIDTSWNNKPIYHNSGKCMLETNKIKQKWADKTAKSFMTPAEFKEFQNNKDIYFNFNRMKQIFKDVKVI